MGSFKRFGAAAAVVGGAIAMAFIPGEQAVPDLGWSAWRSGPADVSIHGEVLYSSGSRDTIRFGFLADRITGYNEYADCWVRAWIDTAMVNHGYPYAPEDFAATADTMTFGPRVGHERIDTGWRFVPANSVWGIDEAWTGVVFMGGGAGKSSYLVEGHSR